MKVRNNSLLLTPKKKNEMKTSIFLTFKFKKRDSLCVKRGVNFPKVDDIISLKKKWLLRIFIIGEEKSR